MKLNIRFINIALSLLLFCVGFLSVSNTVYAYTAEDNFYPLVSESSQLHISFDDGSVSVLDGSYQDGKYYFNNPVLNNIKSIRWHPNSGLYFPYEPDLFDYYLLCTLTASDDANYNKSTFKPSEFAWSYIDYNTGNIEDQIFSDYDFYNIDSMFISGFGFYGHVLLEESNNIGLFGISFLNDPQGSGSKPANLVFEIGVLAVEKGQSETAVLSQILNQLQNMENSINSSIGSAADQVTGSIESASNNITSKLQESFDSLTSNLTEWFDDVFNGYGGSGTDQASDNFDSSAGELHTTETQLTNITNQSVTNYTDFAFNTNVLTTLGASLVYVVTWFTNFWDIGGLFTAVLNIGLALFVAFFILRLRGDP